MLQQNTQIAFIQQIIKRKARIQRLFRKGLWQHKIHRKSDGLHSNFQPHILNYDELARFNYVTATYGEKQKEENVQQQLENEFADVITHVLVKSMEAREATKKTRTK